MTMVELIMAITVTASLSALVFSFYANSSRGFARHLHAIRNVMEAVTVKSQISKHLRDVSLVTSASPGRVEFRWERDSVLHRIELAGDSVVVDKEAICGRVSRLGFTLLSGEQPGAASALLWEAQTSAGEWIGGAEVVEPTQRGIGD